MASSIQKKHGHGATHKGPHAQAARQEMGGGQVALGSLFGLPGITRPTEQIENNDGVATTMSQTTQVDTQFPSNFKQTDVVEWWECEVSVAQTVAAGGGTVTASPYFPYSAIGPVRLNMQNQFDTINVTSGIDMAIFQMLRPHYDNLYNALDQNTISSAYSAEANLTTASNYTSASNPVNFTLDFPPGIYMDRYWELDAKGQPLHKDPIRAFVSPQMMSGTNRIIQPAIRWNPGFAAVSDSGMYTTSGGTPTFAATATTKWRRFGYYQPLGAADSPLMFNWQYSREAKRYSQVAGVSSCDIPLPLNGQILAVWVRLFDPSANSNVGAPINWGTTVKNAYLQYGSGLYRYQDIAADTQRRFYRQHQILPPEGVGIWDMALDKYGNVSNQYALNTLDTSGIQLHFDFNSTLSSNAYVVIGIEALRYVAQM